MVGVRERGEIEGSIERDGMTEATICVIDPKVSKPKKRKPSVSPRRSGGLVVAGARIAYR